MSKLVEMFSMLIFWDCVVVMKLLHAYYYIIRQVLGVVRGGIAVAWSVIPGALSAVDKTMEDTFMKYKKLKGA